MAPKPLESNDVSTMTATPKTIKRNFSDQAWAATPKPVQTYVANLENDVLELLEQRHQLQERLIDLQTKQNKNSKNSNKPSSADDPYRYPSRKKDEKSKRKAGGKAGHQGARQKLMPPSETIPVLPDACECGGKKFEHIEPFYIHQEIELPNIEMQITHFVLHQGDCNDCGETVKATLPQEHPTGYGPRLSAFIADQAGIHGNSRTTIRDFCQSVLEFPISLGAIQKIIDRASQAILPHYQAIAEVARQSKVNGIDETTWRENGTLKYLWVMANAAAAFFMIHEHRSKEAFLTLVKEWKGILISDGYRVYRNWINLRQTCLAHLIRGAQWLTEHLKPDIQNFGEKVLAELQFLCSMANKLPTEKQWDAFHERFINLIYDNWDRDDEAGKFARRLERELDSLWVFLQVLGVDPTNNHTEQIVRFAVLLRKRSQGTRSDKGNRWVERILSLRQTARLRKCSGFSILVNAMECYFKGQKPDLSWINAEIH